MKRAIPDPPPLETPEYPEVLQELIRGIHSGDTALLCGPSISFFSGLPTAEGFRFYLLCSLFPVGEEKQSQEESSADLHRLDPPWDRCLEKLDRRARLSRRVLKKMIAHPPLEILLDMLRRSGWNEGFQEIFDEDRYRPPLRPNPFHRLLAGWIARKGLKTVFTLQWDRLLEKALEQEGWRAGRDFDVLTRQEAWESIDWGEKRVRLFKVNGSVNDPKSLESSARRMARKERYGGMSKVFEHLLATGDHGQVVLFDPSGSDLNVLHPFFEPFFPTEKTVIWVRHSEFPAVEDLRRVEGKHPFRDISRGFRLSCNVSSLIDHLWQVFFPDEAPPVPEGLRWPEKADSWMAAGSLKAPQGWEDTFLGLWLASVAEPGRAVEYHERALLKARSVGDLKTQAVNLNGLGALYASLGEYPEAIEYHEQALKAGREARDRLAQAASLTHLGAVCFQLGEYHEALEIYGQLLKLAETEGDDRLAETALTHLGTLCLQLKKYPQSVAYLERALKLAETAGNLKNRGACLAHLGSVYNNTGEYHRAIEYFTQALRLAEERGDLEGRESNLCHLGTAHHNLGEYEPAIVCFQQALTLSRKRGDRESEGMILANLGTAYANVKEYPEALRCYQSALELARSRGHQEEEGILLANLGTAYRDLGEYEKAVACYEQSLVVKRALGEKENEGILLGHLGTAYDRMGEYGKAVKCYYKSLDILQGRLAPNHLFIKTVEKNILKAKARM